MAFGVTATGFVLKTLLDLKASLETRWHDEFGADADVTPQVPDGQVITIFSEAFSEVWDGMGAVYRSMDPSQNGGAAQDAIAAISGITRLPAKRSEVTVTVVSDADATAVPSGTVFSVSGAGSRFSSTSDVSTAIAPEYTYVATNPVAKGIRRWVDVGGGVFHFYEATVGGTSAGVEPTTQASAIVDGTVTWSFVGIGKAAADAPCMSDDFGPVQGLARTITVIETPVAGVNSAMNLLDAELGSLVESDSAFRIRRELLLRVGGNSGLDSIRANVLLVDGVTACTVLENVTDYTDGNGLPPHSVCVMVIGGDDQAIAQAVWTKAGGIATYGTTTKTVIDTAGNPHDVKFSRPTELDIWVDIEMTYDASLWPENGEDQVIAAVVAFGDTGAVGKNAVSSAIGAQAFKVAGALDVVHCYIGLSNPPVSPNTIPVSLLQIARYDTSRVTVTATAATP